MPLRPRFRRESVKSSLLLNTSRFVVVDKPSFVPLLPKCPTGHDAATPVQHTLSHAVRRHLRLSSHPWFLSLHRASTSGVTLVARDGTSGHLLRNTRGGGWEEWFMVLLHQAEDADCRDFLQMDNAGDSVAGECDRALGDGKTKQAAWMVSDAGDKVAWSARPSWPTLWQSLGNICQHEYRPVDPQPSTSVPWLATEFIPRGSTLFLPLLRRSPWMVCLARPQLPEPSSSTGREAQVERHAQSSGWMLPSSATDPLSRFHRDESAAEGTLFPRPPMHNYFLRIKSVGVPANHAIAPVPADLSWWITRCLPSSSSTSSSSSAELESALAQWHWWEQAVWQARVQHSREERLDRHVVRD